MTEPASSRAWLPDKRWVAVLVAAVVLAYWRMWWAGFIWDDDDYVINNHCLWAWDGLWAIWFDPSRTPQYYPLTHTSFWAEYQLWRLQAPYYHIVNVFLHAANALLLWTVLRKLAVPGAWLGAALFALHPVEVETVAWITERKNTLSAFFGLAFVLAWLRYRFGPRTVQMGDDIGGPEPVPFQWLAVAVALFVASLLCKTVTITLIGVVLVISWWKTGRLSGRDLLGVAPLVCLGLPLALGTVMLEKQHVGAVGAEWALGMADRIVLAGRAIVFYLSKLLWPSPLLFFYPRWEVSATAAWQWLFPAAVIGVLMALWGGREWLGRGPLGAALMFIGMLFPALGFFDVFPFQYSFVADHFQYHASAAALAGLAAATTLALGRLSDARLRMAVQVAWIGVLACITAAQTRMYLGVEPLYQHVLAHDASSFIAANNLGTFYSRLNRLAEAKTTLQVAVRNARFERQKGLALWNVCDLALRMSDNETLLNAARASYTVHPTEASRSMLALALVRNGEYDEAADLLEKKGNDQPNARISEANAKDANRLARAELAAERQDAAGATRHLDLLLQDTSNDWMRLQAGIAFAQMGLGDRAARVLGGLRDHPVYCGCAFFNLGIIAQEKGNQDVAEACFLSAADRDATLLQPYILLEQLYSRQKRFAEAEVILMKALRRAPEDEELMASLKRVRAERGAAAAKRDP